MRINRKWYVVWNGLNPGVYDSWEECIQQIHGVSNARYKSFLSEEEAQKAFYEGSFSKKDMEKEPSIKVDSNVKKAILDSLSVDAACSGNPGKLEYRGVYTLTHTEIFHIGPFPKGTNNIGEFLAIVHALAMLKKMGKTQLPIYTDSATALAWIKNKRCKTLLPLDSETENLFSVISRAENWLKNNTITNPIYKWDTKLWGEIPADFGRK